MVSGQTPAGGNFPSLMIREQCFSSVSASLSVSVSSVSPPHRIDCIRICLFMHLCAQGGGETGNDKSSKLQQSERQDLIQLSTERCQDQSFIIFIC